MGIIDDILRVKKEAFIIKKADDNISENEQNFLNKAKEIYNDIENPFIALFENERYIVVEKDSLTLIIDENLNSYAVLTDDKGNLIKVIDDEYKYDYSELKDGFIYITSVEHPSKQTTVFMRELDSYGPIFGFSNEDTRMNKLYQELYIIGNRLNSLEGYIYLTDQKMPIEITIMKPILFGRRFTNYTLDENNLYRKSIVLHNMVLSNMSFYQYNYEFLKEIYDKKGYDTEFHKSLVAKIVNQNQENKFRAIAHTYKTLKKK